MMPHAIPDTSTSRSAASISIISTAMASPAINRSTQFPVTCQLAAARDLALSDKRAGAAASKERPGSCWTLPSFAAAAKALNSAPTSLTGDFSSLTDSSASRRASGALSALGNKLTGVPSQLFSGR